MNPRLRFGTVLAPFHKPGTNPTLALQSDLELIQWLDRCGFEEAWFGEHHSAGTEISGFPDLMIAAAAERTKYIKLGTGVFGVSYHNPLWIAQRMVMLDHLTRGRAMLGLGPGTLATDGLMIGVHPSQTRELLEDGLGVIMKLLTSEEPITFKNDRWDLRDARLHLRPYSIPMFDIAVTAVVSPTGPKLAGRHGIGMLSIGATTAAGFDALALHWDVIAAEAQAHGKHVDRRDWRLLGLCHIAETKEQAYRDVEYGIEHWFRYFQQVATLHMDLNGDTVQEMIDFINNSGFGAIGTPESCAAQIERLWKQSNGGFGAYLVLAHNWANPEATRRSFELIAREVMPLFQGQHHPTIDATNHAKAARSAIMPTQMQAVDAARKRYEDELAKRK